MGMEYLKKEIHTVDDHHVFITRVLVYTKWVVLLSSTFQGSEYPDLMQVVKPQHLFLIQEWTRLIWFPKFGNQIGQIHAWIKYKNLIKNIFWFVDVYLFYFYKEHLSENLKVLKDGLHFVVVITFYAPSLKKWGGHIDLPLSVRHSVCLSVILSVCRSFGLYVPKSLCRVYL